MSKRKPCEAHHWLVESPDGQQELQARCKRCSARRTYPNDPREQMVDNVWGKKTLQGEDSRVYIFDV